MSLPALRLLDAQPIVYDGRNLICLSDPEGYVEGQFTLSGPAFFIAASLDGTASVEDISRAFRQQFGAGVAHSDIQKVVEFLDNSGLLFSKRFFELKAAACRDFAALDSRRAWLAGKTYPEDPEELRAFCCSLLDSAEPAPNVSGRVKCLIAPHIDFHRGGTGYAAAYASIGPNRPRLVFIFGVAHAGAEAPYILTRKHFETPLGTLHTDVEAVERLAEACAWDAFRSEIAHRTEHSIEFQAVMLAHIFGPDLDDIRIVPVLCGPLADDGPPADPESVAGVPEFLAACREQARAADALVVAGADLAHVGRRFGDDFDIDESVLQAVERRDREDLAFALRGDAPGFYQSVMKDQNARKVCGLGCIHAALSTANGTAGKGQLVHYGCAKDPAGGIVSFAGIIL